MSWGGKRRGTDSRQQKAMGARMGPYLVCSGNSEQIGLGGVVAGLEDQG